MVNFGVNMIGTTCKDDTLSACFLKIFKNLFTLFLDIVTGIGELVKSSRNRFTDFFRGKLTASLP